MEVTCTGSVDLDKHLGLPPEFSRLPIVRGVTSIFSGPVTGKERPLIEACIQHFSADFEDNLSTIVADVRSAVGLPAKRNHWTKGKMEQLQKHFDLYSKKDYLLSLMACKEETTRELQGVQEKLQNVKDTLAVVTKEQKDLAEEYQAALCSTAKVWQRKLSALRAEYRERGMSAVLGRISSFGVSQPQ